MSFAVSTDDDKIYFGQAKLFRGTFNPAANITGWTIEQRFHNRLNAAAVVTLTPTVTDAANGVMTSQLTAAQSMLFTGQTVWCDYWRTDSGSENILAHNEIDVVRTVLEE